MLRKTASTIIFWVFCMTRRGIESRSPGPLANTEFIRLMAWSIYIYIYICVCVRVCMFGQHVFVNRYLIKRYRHLFSTHFCIHPFEWVNRFYGIRQELVYKSLITKCFQSTFCRSWAIIRCMYIAKIMWNFHVHYYFVNVIDLLFILACCCRVYFETSSISS